MLVLCGSLIWWLKTFLKRFLTQKYFCFPVRVRSKVRNSNLYHFSTTSPLATHCDIESLQPTPFHFEALQKQSHGPLFLPEISPWTWVLLSKKLRYFDFTEYFYTFPHHFIHHLHLSDTSHTSCHQSLEFLLLYFELWGHYLSHYCLRWHTTRPTSSPDLHNTNRISLQDCCNSDGLGFLNINFLFIRIAWQGNWRSHALFVPK